ncbi:uncharacterized protein PHALS_12717 [Plasmopara halstedii]|uniref:Uncharacterized protein n=1 Tax=Plasmopara halstedii TaxID=4781 RepID=A0A0P1ANS5_PLAHL|nr:uncharacterized protein PHALS_12717 [Plasmopara halstedii]CEG42440.1 hypothetical protein PHALS_12717 [Plasmopara halstedii]|eukprot:XP_024578809.1 hypothetical protein PHALS_12717 [Plasmopara halstedii]
MGAARVEAIVTVNLQKRDPNVEQLEASNFEDVWIVKLGAPVLLKVLFCRSNEATTDGLHAGVCSSNRHNDIWLLFGGDCHSPVWSPKLCSSRHEIYLP